MDWVASTLDDAGYGTLIDAIRLRVDAGPEATGDATGLASADLLGQCKADVRLTCQSIREARRGAIADSGEPVPTWLA